MAGQGLFEPFPRHVTTHRTSVSRVRDAGGGGVTAAATPAIACIRHARGSAGQVLEYLTYRVFHILFVTFRAYRYIVLYHFSI